MGNVSLKVLEMSLNFLFKNGYEPCRKVLISELNQRRTSTGSGLFSFVNSGFTQIFGKTLRNLSIECIFKTAFYTYDVMELAMDIDNVSKKMGL